MDYNNIKQSIVEFCKPEKLDGNNKYYCFISFKKALSFSTKRILFLDFQIFCTFLSSYFF